MSVLEGVRCPRCDAPLDVSAQEIRCADCRQSYPRLGNIPVLLREPDAYLAACRAQLTLLGSQTAETVRTLREQMDAIDALPSTKARCRAMTQAVERQLADVRALLEPVLTAPAAAPLSAPRAQVPATLAYLHYLYRDWGWPAEPPGENERALAMVESVLQERPLGRLLVLGAGACRLAYELHRRHATETVAVDVDPVLFSAAHAVVRGGRVEVQEANLEVGELAQVGTRWVLTAPAGALPRDRFHFLIADGVEPPFAPGSFDTVLTPWFLDQGPRDVRDFIGTVHRLLAPGGRWLDLGPLLYAPEVPVGRRFGREELFDLAARAGFRVERWESASTPYLVSKLNGRGKVEWVLAFSATKLESDPAAAGDPDAGTPAGAPGDGPPAWLLFTHLPVPAFPGPLLRTSVPRGAELVLSAVDGRRTLDDIARHIHRRAGDATVSLSQIREAVRECLAALHPGSRWGSR